MKLMQGNQRGFTLIEVMVGVLIMALVGLAAAAAIIQVVNAGRNSSHMSTLRQVQTAGYWVSRDGLQAQVVEIGGSAGFPLNLTWTDWDDGDVHQIVYSLQEMYSGSDLSKLWRYATVTPEVGYPTSHTTMVAQYIDGSATSCYWTDEYQGNFTFEVTATVEQQTESRTYEVKPRPEA